MAHTGDSDLSAGGALFGGDGLFAEGLYRAGAPLGAGLKRPLTSLLVLVCRHFQTLPRSSEGAGTKGRSPPTLATATVQIDMQRALKRVAFIRIHATRSNLLISRVREAQNRFPLLSNML